MTTTPEPSVYKAEVGRLIKDFTADGIKIYDSDKLIEKLRGVPSFVTDAYLARLASGETEPTYDKIVLDKWGKKDVETKKYVEIPELVFYRAAMLAADGLVTNDQTLDRDQITRQIFEKFVHRELVPNTPYMANGGHYLLAKSLEDKLGESISPALMNELEQEKKVRPQLFACFVLDLYDSRRSIFYTLANAAEIQAETGGTGFNFSNLRPANEAVTGTGGISDGPVSFMAMYSNAIGITINQGGKREGANMFMLDWNHPDIMRFIYSKREDGEIPAANISVSIDHEFMQAAKSDGEERYYPLKNPHYNPQLRPHVPEFYSEDQLKQSLDIARMNKKAKVSLKLAENGSDVLSPDLLEGLDEQYRIIGKIKEGVVYLDAKKVLHHLAASAWFNGEPGMIITGHINDHNPTHPRHFRDYLLEQKDQEAQEIVRGLMEASKKAPLETLVDQYISTKDENGKLTNLPIGVGAIRATNPCGEKPLLPNEACVLGHINLEALLVRDTNEPSGYRIDRQKLRENTLLMYEILDNAIDQNRFTNQDIEKTQKSNRKIGLGFMGLANMLYKLEIPYDSPEARKIIESLLSEWEGVSDEASFSKAEKLGAFPNFMYSHHRNGPQKRNAIVRTIAPTGTTATIMRTTGGMEPEYALAYTRTTVQGTTLDVINPILKEKLDKYPIFRTFEERKQLSDWIQGKGRGAFGNFEISKYEGESEPDFRLRQANLERLKRIFVTTYEISPEDHILMESVVQEHVDDAISKTTNFRNNATIEDIKRVFMMAYDEGIKGLTFYREDSRKGQPLQVKGSKNSSSVPPPPSNLEQAVISNITRPRPKRVGGETEKIGTPFGYNAFITLNWEKDDDGNPIGPYESFVDLGKAGNDLKATAEGYGRLISMALKANVPPELIIEQLAGIGGEHQVRSEGDKVKSLPDAISQGLQRILDKVSHNSPEKPEKELNKEGKMTGNFCPSCGSSLQFREVCESCQCGFSEC